MIILGKATLLLLGNNNNMKRIFYNSDGEIVAVNYPNKRYLGGTFVDDLSKPIYSEVDDLTKPIMIEALNGTLGHSGAYEKKREITGYEKRELTIDDCKIPEHLAQYSMKTTSEDLPDHEYTNQMIIDGDTIKVDSDKSKTILPLKFVHAKHIKALNKALDLELEATDPDTVKILKLSREKEKALKLTVEDNEKELIEIALAGLSRAPIDKPLIREKLQARLDELTPIEDKKTKKKK